MRYKEYLKTLSVCPFCHLKQEVLLENENAILTYALAPYHKYHLLVIPKRHIEHIKDLEWQEQMSINSLLNSGIKALDKMGHDDCTIVVKDSHKSIPHLHYHIVPGGTITNNQEDQEVRKMLTKSEKAELTEELEKELQTS